MKIIIELDFDSEDFDKKTLKKAVYTYLEELIEDDSLNYTIEE